MINFKILLNGNPLCEAGVSEEDQLEVALVKLLGADQPVLNVTLFEPSTKGAKNFNSWKTEILNVGDEVTIKLNPCEDDSDSFVDGAEAPAELEVESTIFCSFCNKGNFEVERLIAGNDVFICDECIVLCHDIVEDEDT